MAINTNSEWQELAGAPSTPASTRWKIYPKSDGFYFIDDVGVETKIGDAALIKFAPLHTSVTEVGNVTTGEDILMTYTLPSNTLDTDLERIEFEAAGQYAATTNNRRVRVYFDATLIFDTGILAVTVAGRWRIKGTIIREGASAQKYSVEYSDSDASLMASASGGNLTKDLTTSLALNLTGEATATNDIVQEYFTVTFVGAP